MKQKKASAHLDANENFWSLGCILGVALGIPGMILGDQLARTYGISSAVISICVGNLILWLLGLGIISMAQGKSHAIDNIKEHFGKVSSLLAILLFTLAFLMWYTFQLSSTSARTAQVFQFHQEWKIGLVLGSITALLSLGGFKMVKWTSLVGLPILVGITICYITIYKNPIQYVERHQFSYFAILPILMACLSGTVNLPTFFRHSRSREDSIVALSIIMLFHIFFQVSTIFYEIDILSISIIRNSTQSDTISNVILSNSFSIISFICVNLTNVYFVSACWEMLFPRDLGVKKYTIFAITGTLTYICLKGINQLDLISLARNEITYSMSILVLSLLISFIISKVIKHRNRQLGQFFGSMSWIIGCIVTIVFLVQHPEDQNRALIFGCIATVFFSVIVVFVEKFIWSIKNIINEKCN